MTSADPKPSRKRAAPPRQRHVLKVVLPLEFLALCERERAAPLDVLRGFIADLCDIRAWTAQSAYASHGERACRAAREYHAIARQAGKDAGDDIAADSPTLPG